MPEDHLQERYAQVHGVRIHGRVRAAALENSANNLLPSNMREM